MVASFPLQAALDLTLILLESPYFVNPIAADEIQVHLFIDICRNTNTAADSRESVCVHQLRNESILSPRDELEKGF